ncbi:hypothetical protein DY000_02004993 [Brassica cretica]|uniref:Uncharacterized protein n=1 Tax=Brassica cretica TaxID=69181 RepID=A0ABQ7C480_BRACR|nr:hypothetical protein DY000_02004993 [Brassica cretica]
MRIQSSSIDLKPSTFLEENPSSLMIPISSKMKQPNSGKERAVEKGEPPTTPDKGVTWSQKPAAIAKEEGKDAGTKSQLAIESYDATPETEPADHRRRRCVAGDKKPIWKTLLSLFLVKDQVWEQGK